MTATTPAEQLELLIAAIVSYDRALRRYGLTGQTAQSHELDLLYDAILSIAGITPAEETDQ